MIKNHLLNQHTIGGAFVGVVPREHPKREVGYEITKIIMCCVYFLLLDSTTSAYLCE